VAGLSQAIKRKEKASIAISTSTENTLKRLVSILSLPVNQNAKLTSLIYLTIEKAAWLHELSAFSVVWRIAIPQAQGFPAARSDCQLQGLLIFDGW